MYNRAKNHIDMICTLEIRLATYIFKQAQGMKLNSRQHYHGICTWGHMYNVYNRLSQDLVSSCQYSYVLFISPVCQHLKYIFKEIIIAQI